MVFTSNIFLFIFLPTFFIFYYLAPFKVKSPLILVYSYMFYSWWRPDFAILLFGVSMGTYVLTLLMETPSCKDFRKIIITSGVVLNLAVLGYFKYFNFGIDSFNFILNEIGFSSFEYTKVILPIGLSFYIFHAISYMVDVYRGDAPKTDNVFDFLVFIAFFPQLVAGPVLRYEPLSDQFRHREHSWRIFSQGCLIFMAGFCAKVLIADPMSPMVDAAFAVHQPTFIDAWLGTISYTIQLFFDFSGYSTMAIGLGLMVGFIFPKNFDDPYISSSITEFWRRWHMSLSQWLKFYLYIPLGGNQHGRARNYFNLFITMVLGGLWHGANWTFVVWGIWHGGILALEKYWRETHSHPVLPRPLAVVWTLLLVMIGWVFFRAADMGAAWRMLQGMAGLSGWSMSPSLEWQVAPERVLVMIFGIGLAFSLPKLRKAVDGHVVRLLIIPLFLWAVATLSSQAFTPFLYFQF